MKTILEHSIKIPDALIGAVLSQERVSEPPHCFYRYPARFSPAFARETIKAFTNPGDTVIDPFCGGGTSIVEALALGRKAAGFDISSLATFLSRTKTTPLSIHDRRRIIEWLSSVRSLEPSESSHLRTVGDEYYLRNVPQAAVSFFETIVHRSSFLLSVRQVNFIRLVLVAIGQWALDCKTVTPTWHDLRDQFCNQLELVLEGHYNYLSQAAVANNIPRCRLTQMRRILNKSSEESGDDGRIPSEWLPAKLVVTSPPYPGVHVLYHRWQIQGRKETPVPFWLANSQDGAGAAHYCLGHRREPELKTYFARLQKAFSSIRQLVDANSIVVQLVAFSQPEWQLPEYLQRMNAAGFSEARAICTHENFKEGRLWRQVPSRKWYASRKGNLAASCEVLLLHHPVVPVNNRG